MLWTQLLVYVNDPAVEVLCHHLSQMGVNGFEIVSKQDFEQFLTGTTTYWDYVDNKLTELLHTQTHIKIYFAQNRSGDQSLAQVKDFLQGLSKNDQDNLYGSLETKEFPVDEADFENNWKEYFKPFEVGNRFVIKPTWEDYSPGADKLVIELDPGLCFGTGTHATTKLCLQSLEKHLTPGQNLLDLGSGSGILSVGAGLLGASFITAVDIDENSTRITKENLQKNNIPAENYAAFTGNILNDQALMQAVTGKKYQFIVANIVADVIIAFKEIFEELMDENAKLVVSGIIGDRAKEVLEHLTAAGFKLVEETSLEDWVAFCFVR